jgi:hypothetical protein
LSEFTCIHSIATGQGTYNKDLQNIDETTEGKSCADHSLGRMLRTGCRILHGAPRYHCRAFTCSAPGRFGLGTPIELTADLFRSIHDLTGLTYAFSIPLTAIALRTAVTLPLAIYSQKKLNRRIELRPLFFHWGDVVGMQSVARQKAHNVDLRSDKKALARTMSTVQKMVSSLFPRLTLFS